MHYAVLATDYDGTIAHDGVVDDATLDALERLKAGQRRLVLVTGRELPDLQREMPRLDLFDRVVAENGALLYTPATREQKPLGEAPPAAFVERLRALEVSPLSVGRVIVASWEPNEGKVLDAIRDLGLELQIIFNKGAVMVLPAGVNKATGLLAALCDLGLSPLDCVGVGDAENDNAFLEASGFSVAVANALPALKERATFVTEGQRGAGVAELIDRMLADDLEGLDTHEPRQSVLIAEPRDGDDGPALHLQPKRETLLLAGASGGGKSTLTLGLLERLGDAGFQYCVIDPEGDYEGSLAASYVGDARQPADVSAVMGELRKPQQSVAVNLLGVPLQDRPAFYAALLPELARLRETTGRPHFVVVDEAHHLLPTEWNPPAGDFSASLQGTMFVTVHPEHLSPRVLDRVDRMLVIGRDPAKAAGAFCGSRGLHCPAPDVKLETGEVMTFAAGDPDIRVMRVVPGNGTRQRHVRKYAEGKLGEDKSFYFRGPDRRLNLRAHNLTLFVQIAEGVDAETWEHHRRAGDFSEWIGSAIKDGELARAIAAIEQSEAATDDSRRQIQEAIEAKYTAPA
ncbi:MAG: HAD-IIB family hydrolase [Acetobacteraceae bacterium]|nr:HAD-IIB family hydrolase [Acetobacteraceae bacterium]